jgi:hypothetical protein
MIVVPNEPVLYKVLAGWYGGYTGGDSWQINSGIVEIIEEELYYDVVGESGSVYRCPKHSEKLSGYTQGIFSHYQQTLLKQGVEMNIVKISSILHQFRKVK